MKNIIKIKTHKRRTFKNFEKYFKIIMLIF